jgi:hypothetical protein
VEIQKLSDILGNEFDDRKTTENLILDGHEGSCVAEALISLVSQLLFLTNFTIFRGDFDASPGADNSNLIWY